MSDNIILNDNTTVGKTVASRDDGTAQHELVMLEYSDNTGQPVEVSVANPLPVSASIDTTGLATSAKQDTGNTSLASIDTKLTSPLTVQATNLDIRDLSSGTDSVTVTGTVTANTGLSQPLTDTQLRATPIPISGTVTATASGTQDTNTKQVNAQTVDVGTGAAGTGTQRVAVANDSSIILAAGTAEIGNVKNSGTFAVQATPVTQADTFMLGGVNVKEINGVTPLMGAGNTGTGSPRVTIATDQVSIPVAATLTAETTKVIGVTRTADGAGNLLTTNSTTPSAKFSLDTNITSILGTAPSAAGKLDVKSTQKPSYGIPQILAVTALQSLTSSATVGWKSAMISNLFYQANDWEVFVSLTTANTAPASDKCMYVYLIPWYLVGSTWYAASGGTATLPTSGDAGYTIASPNNFIPLGILNYTTAQMTVQGVFLISNCFGNRLPDGFSFCIINFSGATLGTGCILDCTPLNDTLT